MGTADVPKVEYCLTEIVKGRRQGSAPAHLCRDMSCCNALQHADQTMPTKDSGSTHAATNVSKWSEHSVERLQGQRATQLQHPVELPVRGNASCAHFCTPGTSENVLVSRTPLHPGDSHTTPPRPVENSCRLGDDLATVSLTLAASSPSTTWKTSAGVTDSEPSGDDCEELTHSLARTMPVQRGYPAAQPSLPCNKHTQASHHCRDSQGLTAKGAQSPIAVDSHAQQSQGVAQESSPAVRQLAHGFPNSTFLMV